MKYILKIDGVPKESEYNTLSFNRQTDYRATIEAFKAKAKHIHFSCKRTSTATGFREFKKLYQPAQWFAINRDAHMYHDDSFEVWYLEKDKA